MRDSSTRRWISLFLLVVVRCVAADEKPFTRDPLTAIKLEPSLLAFATREKIPVDGIELADAGTAKAGRDSITMLFALIKGDRTQQWLVRLSAASLSQSENKLPMPEAVMHTSTGNTFHYAQSPEALQVEFFGPFAQDLPLESASGHKARAVVNGNYLRQGIAEYCQSGLDITRRMKAAGANDLIFYGGGYTPSPEAVEKGRKSAERINLTADEERLAFSVYFSLNAFFSAAMEIPVCRDVLEEVVAKPSLWSIARNFGVRTDFKYGWPGAQEIASPEDFRRPMYSLPVEIFLNGKSGVKATLAVTAPQPPLQVCAGIFALCAEHPTDASRRIFIRLLAARP